jgi:hypothetical protein
VIPPLSPDCRLADGLLSLPIKAEFLDDAKAIRDVVYEPLNYFRVLTELRDLGAQWNRDQRTNLGSRAQCRPAHRPHWHYVPQNVCNTRSSGAGGKL